MGSIGYATSKDWLDIMKNRSKLRMHELIERLGLRAKWSQNKRGKTNFESALVRDLVTDMGDIVATVPKESDDLVKFLSAEKSLNEQVEGLLQKHGSAIWGRVGDREHLISVGEPGVEEELYPRDLYFEEEQDREQIRILLHWWLGMKAINVILARDRLDRERKKKEENKRARIEMEVPLEGASSAFVPLAPNSGAPAPLNTNIPPVPLAEHPRHVQLYKAETTSRGSPISVAVSTPPESSQSPIGPGQGQLGGANASHFSAANPSSSHPSQAQSVVDGVWNRLAEVGINGSRNGSMSSQAAIGTPSWPAVNAGTHPVVPRRASLAAEVSSQPAPVATISTAGIRQLGAEISQLVSDLTPQATATNGHSAVPPDAQRKATAYPGLDVETLYALREYIYQEKTEVDWEEEALLRRLETQWRDGVRTDHNRMLENVPAFIARERAFLTWIELKRHLADLQRAGTRWGEEGTTAPEIERRIEQHRTLMSATREIIRSFEDIAQVAGAGADHDELLRQALVVLAGNKYAVELQWKNVEFVGLMQWLAGALESYEKEQEGDTVYYFS
ncbi:uncharacterized protein N0V89_008833 [Didymosphaeria variabile]|uniref:Uncharacterized protein n=1 Tax=Didymosphaeria variabile TaxID=1932322 RepID=A0A9W9C9N3_9PLEO|nr:uncharacterized protein N0V89_008833 [Didymosphaeria variabile]KAJ4350212.1 hypothetical protein N0V89_008833 [Didymosphaeria variabile]